MMVESEAKELSEDVMLGAVMFAHKASGAVIDAIIKLAEQSAKEPWELKTEIDQGTVKAKLKSIIGDDLTAAYKLTDKQERQTAINAARTKAREAMEPTKHNDPADYLGFAQAGEDARKRTSCASAILKDGQPHRWAQGG